MDWTQTITLGGTLIAYMTGMCIFFYHLNEKSIDKIDKRISDSESHWREMFMYMNNKIDNINQKSNNNKDS